MGKFLWAKEGVHKNGHFFSKQSIPKYMRGRVVFIETDTPPPLKQIETEEEEEHED